MSYEYFNGEVSTPKKQHLVIFMSVLVTTSRIVFSKGIEYWVVSTAFLYKAVMRSGPIPMQLNYMKMLVNEIHNDILETPKAVYCLGKVRQKT